MQDYSISIPRSVCGSYFPMENIAKMLGHSDIRMTQRYAKVMDSSIMRDMENVDKLFKSSE